ncbi:LytR/AlgR family response regulator transcription factor [Microbulbifer sp. ZKSA002]|uniref:LytR/AlgR family response regulator transcription factor n=1 Tax=Microbulbifer sp. ZKSA002 TaxID=3243388 RepID=UPI004039B0BC
MAHQILLHYSHIHNDIKIVKQCYSATEALDFLTEQQVDLIFLDIQMPALTGLKMLETIANRPQVVLCTAYQEYALNGFELDVTDYLLKPFSIQRFAEAMDKVRRRINEIPLSQTATAPNYIIIRVDREDRKIALDNIQYFQAYGNYVKVWMDEDCLLTAATLKHFSKTLPENQFIQVHKSFLVNKKKITAQNSNSIKLNNNSTVKIGKSFRHNLMELWQ